MRIAYADPPFPGQAGLYADQPGTVGEVDHAALLRELETYDGWALSTSSDPGLRLILPLCPVGVKVCPWVKPRGVDKKSRGLNRTWEPLIVSPARRDRPGMRDWLKAHAARGGGTLIGRKPLAFCRFMFRAVGLRPGDSLADLYPGTGIVGRAWAEASRSSRGDG